MDYGTLEVSTPDGQVRQYPIDVPSVVIGRAESNRVVVDHVSVSRRHAHLVIDSSQVMLEDLDSARGTFVDGQQLEPNVPRLITEGQQLRFGDCQGRYLAPRTSNAPITTGGGGEVTEQAITVSVTGPNAPVAPGSRTTATLAVVNQGRETDELTLSVLNLPDGWAHVTRSRLTLVPGARDEVTITIEPPRGAATTAGEHTFAAAAVSRVHGVEVRALGRLQVLPYEESAFALEPQRAKRDFRAVVENRGNSEASFALAGRAEEEPLTFAFARPEVTLGPGEREVVPVRVKPEKFRLYGKERLHRFQVEAKPASGAKPLAATAELRAVTPLYPWRWLGLVMLIGLLVGGGLFGYSQLCGDNGVSWCSSGGGTKPLANDQTPTKVPASTTPGTTQAPGSPSASASPAATTPPASATSNVPPGATKLKKGQVAVVVNSPQGDCLFVRSSPSRQDQSNVTGKLCDGDTVTLVDGPYPGEGYLWWKVHQDSTGLEGVASEGLLTGADPRFLAAKP